MPWQVGSYVCSLHVTYQDWTTQTWVFNHRERSDDQAKAIEEIKELFEQKGTVCVAHNAKFDIHWLRYLGVDVDIPTMYCTMLVEYLLRAQRTQRDLNLADLSEYYGIPKKKDKVKTYWDVGIDTYDIPLDLIIPYGEQDSVNCLAIYVKQQEQIRRRTEEFRTLVHLEMATMMVANEMEWNGMLLDVARLIELETTYEQRKVELLAEFDRLVGTQLDLSKADQVSAVLYGGSYKVDGQVPGKREGTFKKGKVDIPLEGVGFVPLKGTETARKGVFKVDKPTLARLKAKTKQQKVVLATYTEYQNCKTMVSTFFKGLLSRHVDGYVHPNINQAVAKTGRWTCSNPNGQNIPRGTTGPVKEAFISRYKE